jgi:DNA-binding transcriptional LysR family regulator
MTQTDPSYYRTSNQRDAQLKDGPQAKAGAGVGFGHFRRSHDVRNLYVNLKQWRILHAVVDCKGFSEAAEFLHLSQSAVSYTISKLQEQVGMPLLLPGRKIQLTPAGRALLDRSRLLLREAIELEQYAEQLRQGREGEINLIVDVLFPSNLMFSALTQFKRTNAQVSVRLREVTAVGADKLLHKDQPDLAIVASVPFGFLAEPLLDVTYVAVAHASHPLARLQRPIHADDLSTHVRICADIHDKTHSSYNRRTVWSVKTVRGAVEAVQAGLGYGWLPKYLVTELIDKKVLVKLPVTEGQTYVQTIYMIHAPHRRVPHACAEFSKVLRNVCADPGMCTL